ncbi:ankyrin repeat domain-containing protein [Afifella sp. YEN Y35]|uniref:ankyrin repeat domain-containing protein n=1 Tax=Afifella sp. YEN Y35 TaxID=3388337 RepID=UPI0039E06B0E
MPKKRSTLPKNFEELLTEGDLDRLKAVFDKCDLDARGGIFKQSALAFAECPDELMRWLVRRGADLHAEDKYGETPLHSQAGHWRGKVEALVTLGADVDRGVGSRKGTPLHRASRAGLIANVRQLLAAGASVDALDGEGRTPLERCFEHCTNANVDRAADVAAALLNAGAQATSRCRTSVTRIGETFEFHRAGFNPERVDQASRSLEELYRLFDVTPVPRRTMHDGTSPIIATAARWEDRFNELWELLVPSSGAAQTVQGEVVRLAGKIQRELDGNGGANWDDDFHRMADAWLVLVGSGTPLGGADLAEAGNLVVDAKARGGDMERLCALAVSWVERNPDPVPLPPPLYAR